MRKAFTLIELLIVIVIIGVLASMSASHYRKVVEISRVTEAKTTLNMLRAAQRVYFMEHNPPKYATVAELGFADYYMCAPDRWFDYQCDPDNLECSAYRCTGGSEHGPGKNPDWHVNYRVRLDLVTGEFRVADIETGL
ncbi:MAG: prepilin-type N-terminal cleavage/methylation domain-containing protein [Candidatus Omnitrophota bacterium]